jgi:hypothetical protein
LVTSWNRITGPSSAKGRNGFTGRIDKITIELEKMTPGEEEAAEKAEGESNEVEVDED